VNVRDTRRPGPVRLGDLERAVMDVLAYTTIKTVLDRLADKGLATRHPQGRAWTYRAAASRDGFIAELMLQALDMAGDRDAALMRFAGAVTTPDADVLRRALRRPRTS
jgi:predicted transcriptional regulator